MQDLKGKIARGEYPPKSELIDRQTEQVDEDHSIPATITKYRARWAVVSPGHFSKLFATMATWSGSKPNLL